MELVLIYAGHPDTVVEWMRNGKWTKTKDYGEGTKENSSFPNNPIGLDASGANLEKGLKNIGFNEKETNDILGNNWAQFYKG